MLNEAQRRSKVAAHIFREEHILDFMCVRDNIAKKKRVAQHNKEVTMLKELAKKFKVSTPAIEGLELKEVVI